MKPTNFEIIRPATLADACKILEEGGDDARVVAGCQSLGPMLNLRLANPRVLVDITGIDELTQVRSTNDTLLIGACVTTAAVEDGRLPGRGLDALARIAQRIAYRAVRNRGTVGGSICHADPAADWVSTLCAFGAQCTVFSSGGRRQLPAKEFITGAFANALRAGEILESIEIPRLSDKGRCGFYKVCRKAGEFASALGAVIWDESRDVYRAVIGATAGPPIVVDNAQTICNNASGIDTTAVYALLDERNIRDATVRSQQIAALSRAYEQAMR